MWRLITELYRVVKCPWSPKLLHLNRQDLLHLILRLSGNIEYCKLSTPFLFPFSEPVQVELDNLNIFTMQKHLVQVSLLLTLLWKYLHKGSQLYKTSVLYVVVLFTKNEARGDLYPCWVT